MSYLFGLFAAGVSCTILILLLTGLYRHHLATTAVYVGGFWAMVPELHYILPSGISSDFFFLIYSSPISDIFFFHYTINARIGQSHANVDHYVSAGLIGVMIVLLFIYTYFTRRSIATE